MCGRLRHRASGSSCTYWYVHFADILAESLARGEIDAGPEPADTASTVVAVLQGGYVLARAADSTEPYHQAVRGALGLLAALERP